MIQSKKKKALWRERERVSTCLQFLLCLLCCCFTSPSCYIAWLALNEAWFCASSKIIFSTHMVMLIFLTQQVSLHLHVCSTPMTTITPFLESFFISWVDSTRLFLILDHETQKISHSRKYEKKKLKKTNFIVLTYE